MSGIVSSYLEIMQTTNTIKSQIETVGVPLPLDQINAPAISPNSRAPFYNLPKEIDPLNAFVNKLLPEESSEEKEIRKASEILGSRAANLTASDIKDAISEIQYLVDTWLDDYEKQIFNGQTLMEFLQTSSL